MFYSFMNLWKNVVPPGSKYSGSAPGRGTIYKPAELLTLWIISIYIGSTHAI